MQYLMRMIPITFSASATDPEEGDVSPSIIWTSSLAGQIGTGSSFSASLAVGTHTITATATDSVPQSGSDQITITVIPDSPTQTIEIPVSTGSDDAEERGSGLSMLLTSKDIELVEDGTTQQTVGLRFNGFTIPNGATITNAYVQFQADETDSGANFAYHSRRGHRQLCDVYLYERR